jgi:hypothetical protein
VAIHYFRENFFVLKAEEQKVAEDRATQYQRPVQSGAQQYQG